jgi:fermentation-respiration switch protein FrsA (DUF1100 family)
MPLVRILLGVAIGYALLCALMYLARDRLVFPIRGGTTGVPARYGMPDGERVTITTPDGERLAAWYLPPCGGGGSPKPGAVLWFHGNGETIGDLAPVIRELRPEHAALLIVEFRDYGESSGSPTVANTTRDAEAAWDWLAARSDIDPSRIVVYGRSVGTGPAVHLAATRKVAGIILESTFTSLRAMARYHYRIFPSVLAGSGFDNLAAASRVRAPALLIHGASDRLVPIAMARMVAAALAGPVEFWTIPGAGHNDTYNVGGDEYARRFKTFVDSTR